MLMRFSHVIHFQEHSKSLTKSMPYTAHCAGRFWQCTAADINKPDAKIRCECLFSRKRLPYPEHPACNLVAGT